jgi:uncharacterized Zn-binding protein involved in type VI secretion
MHKLIVLLSVVFSISAIAGNVVSTQFKTQVLISQSKGKLNGCGVRFVGIQDITLSNQEVRVIDGSFNVYSEGISITKAGMSATNSNDVIKGNRSSTSTEIKSYWMRRAGGSVNQSVDDKFSKSTDTKGFLIQAITVDSFLDLVQSVNSGKEFQIGVSQKKDNSEWVFAGQLSMEAVDSGRLQDCLRTLFEIK